MTTPDTPNTSGELDPVAIECVRLALAILSATYTAGGATHDPTNAPLWAELAARDDTAHIAVAIADLAAVWVRHLAQDTGTDPTTRLRTLAVVLAALD